MLNHEWFDISTAPKQAFNVWIKKGSQEVVAHYACNLSGEEQPPFEGYFQPVVVNGLTVRYDQVAFEPTLWRPILDTDPVSVGGKQFELPGVLS